ncbi:MAG: protein kinase [Deltaproteobacteria bacterium]|nr:protein kinase [Deltaproteobacteria bacterium]
MSDDKRTKIGATGPARTPPPMNPTPAPVTSGMAVPATDTGAHSYLPPAADPLIGATLAGRYSITKKLGEGGMGAVYLATHVTLEKQVALKILHGEFSRKQDLVDRFMQEAKAASRVRHENVIDISDFGASDGFVFFAMELLKGHDLHEEVARARLAGQLLPWARSKKIFLQICAALAAAHSHGIIHRDLKPENVYLVEFLGEPDFVKLLDFGIAKLTEVSEGDRKLTRTGMLFGTPEYMSPEQARGEPHVDARVDVYAMGCILFQLVTGRVPFEAENFMGVLSLHLTELPPIIPDPVFDRIGAPRELAQVIDKALQKDREQRWQSITELANAIRQVCGDPIPTGMTGVVPVQRPASVPAPATTTERPPSRPPDPASQYRQRTQWTGNLSVPAVDEVPAKKSKLPLIVGAILVAGAAAGAAAFLATRGGDKGDAGPGTASAAIATPGSGTAGPGGSGGSQQQATVTPDAGAPEVPGADKVEIRIESTPPGARVKDVLTGAWFPDKLTPTEFTITKGTAPRAFLVALDGYEEQIVEVLPTAKRTESVTLKKNGKVAGTGSAKPPKLPGTGSQGSAKPPGPGSQAVTPPGPGSQARPPQKDPCDDLPPDVPCLKTVVPNLQPQP